MIPNFNPDKWDRYKIIEYFLDYEPDDQQLAFLDYFDKLQEENENLKKNWRKIKMKKIEKEITDIIANTDIIKSLTSTKIIVNFCAELNLTEEELEIFEDSLHKGKIKIVCKVEDDILDEVEREYLRGVIKPFKNKVAHITKNVTEEGEYVEISLKNYEYIELPYFKKGKMYRGMKLEKEYTLEELCL